MSTTPLRSVTQLVAVLTDGHRRPLVEDLDRPGRRGVDVLSHSLQTAHEAYLMRPDDEGLQVAALVHDIGLLLETPGMGHSPDHAIVGARAVGPLLGGRVERLVALHADARRYLAALDHLFVDAMTGDARRTLDQRGGPMSASELVRFEQSPDHCDALLLAAADDLAHVPGRQVPSLMAWLPIIVGVVASATTEPAAEDPAENTSAT